MTRALLELAALAYLTWARRCGCWCCWAAVCLAVRAFVTAVCRG